MGAGKRVSCVPGLEALTDKHRLVATLLDAYGTRAFDIIPRSYLLPAQYWKWRAWLLQQVRTHPCITSPAWPLPTPSCIQLILWPPHGHACEVLTVNMPALRHLWLHSEQAGFCACMQHKAGGLWILKENRHRGKGVFVADAPTAVHRARSADKHGRLNYVVAQQYINNQLLVNRRQFYVR